MCVSLVTGPRLLSVLGRDVTLEKTCGSIADCTFDELCGRVSDVFFLQIYILYFSICFNNTYSNKAYAYR